jgi:hypothetical protein
VPAHAAADLGWCENESRSFSEAVTLYLSWTASGTVREMRGKNGTVSLIAPVYAVA